MTRFTNPQIKEALTELRVAIREGKTKVDMKQETALKNVVGAALRGLTPREQPTPLLDETLFSRACMNPQTAWRFTAFFEDAPEGTVEPDDVAWAIQNFINRRSDPWGFWYRRNDSGVAGLVSSTPSV